MATQNAERATQVAPIASSSLYVGDLSPEVTESVLYDFFNAVGPVASIRVCRDNSSRRSLGYAYVNYHSIHDAERALKSLNYSPIKGIPCRIMWSQRDTSNRTTVPGNLFVRNIDRSIGNKEFHELFATYGNILSAKIVCDEAGKSKGFGFVHFDDVEHADAACKALNGTTLGTKEIFVCPFKNRTERANGKNENFTNVYIRNIPECWDADKIRSVFETFGEITSVFANKDAKDRPFACVNFANSAIAKSVVAMNGKHITVDGFVEEPTEESMEIYLCRAQDKSERVTQTKVPSPAPVAPVAAPVAAKNSGVNLYIKNLADNIDDEALKQMFSKYGDITSAKVMTDEDGNSKGFGFVAFQLADVATKAIADMHLTNVGGKPLYVGIAEQKERRQARLQSHFKSRAPAAAPNVPVATPFFNPPWVRPGQIPAPMWQGNPKNMMAQVPMAGMPAAPAPAAPRPAARRGMDPAHKQVLGEQLYPIVFKFQPDLAGKITGMMLDMNEDELRGLMSNEAELRKKVDEAVMVLQNAQGN